MSEAQHLARQLGARLACLGLDELRVVDHVVTRLELGRDWGKELGEELVDALVYHAARELAAQDLARASLREAARVEMLGNGAFQAATEQHAAHDAAAGRYAVLRNEAGAAFVELLNRECDAAIAAADRREADLDAHGYGRPMREPTDELGGEG